MVCFVCSLLASSSLYGEPLPWSCSKAPTIRVTMSSRKPNKKSPKRPRSGPNFKFLSTTSGPSRTPAEKEEAVDRVLVQAGIKKPRPSDILDKEYTSIDATYKEKRRPTLYKTLMTLFGSRTLQVVETGMLGALVTLVSVFLSTGVAASYQAFLKASSQPIPEALDNFLNDNFENTFTPSLLLFLGLSVLYGLFKQSQLRSGVTNYDERDGH